LEAAIQTPQTSMIDPPGAAVTNYDMGSRLERFMEIAQCGNIAKLDDC
jgi:hypothetical protein